MISTELAFMTDFTVAGVEYENREILEKNKNLNSFCIKTDSTCSDVEYEDPGGLQEKLERLNQVFTFASHFAPTTDVSFLTNVFSFNKKL